MVRGFAAAEPTRPISINGHLIEVTELRNRFGHPLFHFEAEELIPGMFPGATVFSEPLEGIIGIESPIVIPDKSGTVINQVVPFGEELQEDLEKLHLPGLGRLRKAFAPGVEVFEVDLDKVPTGADTKPKKIEPRGTEAFRYPVGEFYVVGSNGDSGHPGKPGVLIPISDWIREPSTPSSRVEFRFRLDTKKTGIPFKGSPPGLKKPRDVNYPLTLDVDVWSDEIGFIADEGLKRTARRQIQLDGPGPSTIARFPVQLPAAFLQKRKGVIFVFLRHADELIAGFRVETALTPEGVENEQAQTLEHIYLSEKWFTFEGVQLQAPSVTIYFRRENDIIRLFCFSKNNALWAEIQKDAKDFGSLTRDIYLEIEKLAENSQHPGYKPMPNEAYAISHRGFQIFSAMFYSQSNAQRETSAGFGDRIKGLAEGSWVTIATDNSSKDFVIPWGMIYDRTPPMEYPGVPEITGFWGARFKLTVQPSVGMGRSSGEIGTQPSVIGRVYENHDCAVSLISMFKQLQDQGQVREVTDLKIDDYWLPDLLKTSFDFIHFFCHGYTKLADDELRQSLLERTKASSNLMYAADTTLGSHIKAQQGRVTFAQLQLKLARLIGSPIIHLSMCQSAQVSCSGDSFVTLFLNRGARAVVGTEGPIPFELARQMDEKIINDLLVGTPLRDAVWNARQKLFKQHFLALIYIVYGDGLATLASQHPTN